MPATASTLMGFLNSMSIKRVTDVALIQLLCMGWEKGQSMRQTMCRGGSCGHTAAHNMCRHTQWRIRILQQFCAIVSAFRRHSSGTGLFWYGTVHLKQRPHFWVYTSKYTVYDWHPTVVYVRYVTDGSLQRTVQKRR